MENKSKNNKPMSKEDICTHLGDDYELFEGAVVPPIFQNTLFVTPRSSCTDKKRFKYSYTRDSNPTIEVAEKKIAALEEGEAARCFGSGMAAISSAVLYWIHKDSHVVTVRNVYGGTRELLQSYVVKFGVETTFVTGESIEEFERAIRPNTSLIYLESPSSLVFTLQDIAGVVKIAKARGIGTVIDNTWATPLYQNPLKMGVDMVVHSASKYMGGHSDIVGGVVIGNRELIDSIHCRERSLLGGIMDPHQAWLLTRGLRTLPVRMKQHQESAFKVASFLEGHPKVSKVLYPGLKSFKQYELGRKQLTGYSGLMSFVPVCRQEDVMRFVNGLKYFQIGPSWGGYESLIIPIGHEMNEEKSEITGIPRNLVRISVGLENPDTLIDDLDRNLK